MDNHDPLLGVLTEIVLLQAATGLLNDGETEKAVRLL